LKLPYKDPVKRKAYATAYNKKHYAENKEYYKEKARKSRAAHKKWCRELKVGLSCQVCGMDDPIVLDFHHRDESTKEFCVSEGKTRGYSRQRMLDEIEKCDVLCSNCHRRHHHG